MIDKNPVLSVVDGKMCINGKTFEHTELRESKEYLQRIDAEEALFYPENEEEIEEMQEIITIPIFLHFGLYHTDIVLKETSFLP